ncbi:hypothetical protein TTHERM_000787228 (macronuclear) [Tetrahymena thermophila SB210]|uniref:Uncharacterized protein n=1 Tax=Tetrahymena thermophila (strain SB210) TaxID=312017 RepID=W7X5Z7_TETTS|nr:hypothetical protein TTHERM_000787228 [Tetrahymena thermophila SB210]EWS72792.1 hypothetical protein TTHERM_000787228 [Tetrahymena thermophila SB210]|eukprot:XP_012654679.1 hypothetical protein TTHERM_000787228 [Tetrahymena thermophila SB210]
MIQILIITTTSILTLRKSRSNMKFQIHSIFKLIKNYHILNKLKMKRTKKYQLQTQLIVIVSQINVNLMKQTNNFTNKLHLQANIILIFQKTTNQFKIQISLNQQNKGSAINMKQDEQKTMESLIKEKVEKQSEFSLNLSFSKQINRSYLMGRAKINH